MSAPAPSSPLDPSWPPLSDEACARIAALLSLSVADRLAAKEDAHALGRVAR